MALSAVPGVSQGRGLLIPLSVSEIQSRRLWALSSKWITFLVFRWSSLISVLLRTVVSNSFDWTRLFYLSWDHDTTLTVILKFALVTVFAISYFEDFDDRFLHVI